MNALRRLIRRLLGQTAYHRQANDVQLRELRLSLLSKQLEVIQRGRR